MNTITLTIDGEQVTVSEGTTLLDAAVLSAMKRFPQLFEAD